MSFIVNSLLGPNYLPSVVTRWSDRWCGL